MATASPSEQLLSEPALRAAHVSSAEAPPLATEQRDHCRPTKEGLTSEGPTSSSEMLSVACRPASAGLVSCPGGWFTTKSSSANEPSVMLQGGLKRKLVNKA